MIPSAEFYQCKLTYQHYSLNQSQHILSLWKALDITILLHRSTVVLYCGRVPTTNAPGCTAAEGLLYKPWSLVIPTCTARCLHQRP